MSALQYPRSRRTTATLHRPARHRLPRRATQFRDPRHRLLPRPELSRHRPRRPSTAIAELRGMPRATPRFSARVRSRCSTASSTHGRSATGRKWRSSRTGSTSSRSGLRRSDAAADSQILDEKREVRRSGASSRRSATSIARLARREFVDISTEMSFRFRDIYDHLVRIADDAMIFQDRITGILDAHLSNVSNRLNR